MTTSHSDLPVVLRPDLRLARDPVEWQAKETLGYPLESRSRREADLKLWMLAHAVFWFLAGVICTVIAVLLTVKE